MHFAVHGGESILYVRVLTSSHEASKKKEKNILGYQYPEKNFSNNVNLYKLVLSEKKKKVLPFPKFPVLKPTYFT